MNNKHNPAQFDEPLSFDEVNTFPSGWDVSAIFVARDASAEQPPEMADDAGQDPSAQDGATHWTGEKFPEPRTTPRHWNLSALL
jgi:hypothetical protein